MRQCPHQRQQVDCTFRTGVPMRVSVSELAFRLESLLP